MSDQQCGQPAEKKKADTPIAEHDGIFYIKAEAVPIHPLLVITEMDTIRFPDGPTPYLRIKDAIRWLQADIRNGSKNKDYATALDCLKEILDKCESGRVIDA